MAGLKSFVPSTATLTELYDGLDTALLQARAIHSAQRGAPASGQLADGAHGHIELAVAAMLDEARRTAEELHLRARLPLDSWREC